MRRKQKIFGRPNHETQRCCPTKPDSGFFVPSSRDRESRCWPPCGPVRRFSPQGGEATRTKPQKAEFGPTKARLKKSPDKSTGRGVKKKQVKGCGSVNRPTPSSQRPAEPVASGFFPGVNFPVFMGQFWSLGVKPWVREQENPGIPGKIRGSNCGFGPKSEGEKAYDRTEIPCARKA